MENWQWIAIGRLLLCVLIGGAVGLEREYHGRAAGFRTHILVCLGCCVVMLGSTHFVRLYSHLGEDTVVRLDPARLAYGVLTGIGFLGAGVIMKTDWSVHGLTTAASLWIVAALGLTTGLGMYVVAGVGAALSLFTLTAMRQVGHLVQSHHYRRVSITLSDPDELDRWRSAIESGGATILRVSLDHQKQDNRVIAEYELRFRRDWNVEEVYDLVKRSGEFIRVEIQ
ncbi:MAG TPA: MgtC/SapB family protein [Phycisphaerae bacterium]|nr:MgtC/SapB family protein [Phycisphaerales bacterium]HNO80161.1 MgtC/SapB family protein [Phycisphaerae bacterium]